MAVIYIEYEGRVYRSVPGDDESGLLGCDKCACEAASDHLFCFTEDIFIRGKRLCETLRIHWEEVRMGE